MKVAFSIGEPFELGAVLNSSRSDEKTAITALDRTVDRTCCREDEIDVRVLVRHIVLEGHAATGARRRDAVPISVLRRRDPVEHV